MFRRAVATLIFKKSNTVIWLCRSIGVCSEEFSGCSD